MSQPPASAHLYLAELSDDDPHASLSHYMSAIWILRAQLNENGNGSADEDPENEKLELRKNIVRMFAEMVELWMDPRYDLWCVLHLFLFVS